MFISDAQRKRLLLGVFKEYYALHKESVVFDTNRIWTSKLPVLAELFPDIKMVCCVRNPHAIVNSIEVLLQKSPLQLSGIFGFEPGGTVYTRCSGLLSGGMVGFALEALREGCYGPHKDKLMLVEYQALATHPSDALKAIYDWLELPWWEYHDFDNVEQIPGVDEFDRKLGTPGLHALRSKVEWSGPPVSVLPPDLASSIPSPFWQSSGFNVPVLRCAPTTEAKVQNGQSNAT